MFLRKNAYLLFGATFCSRNNLKLLCKDGRAHCLCSFTHNVILMCTNSTYRWGHTEGDEQKPRTESEKLRPSLAHVCVCQVINNSMFLGGFATRQPEGFNLNALLFSSPQNMHARANAHTVFLQILWPGRLSALREEQQIVIYCIAICATAAALGVGVCNVVLLVNSLFFLSRTRNDHCQ